ncbi:unnamed protein product [Gongylonema pulchrum]|uniref:Nodule Cysteine-Rich (NCR) secreted peptide n=1 Tax=Gongylonema pulchrum TaxID=637853 RepID=A0A183DBK7_9BILA|nr:unnamed protein product [Gongylonema pulchrum]
MKKLSLGNWECIADEDCPLHHKCGLFKKCYDMRNKIYVVETIQHICMFSYFSRITLKLRRWFGV